VLGDWAPLIWLSIASAFLLPMKRWINRHLQGLGYLLFEDSQMALILYFVVMLPGIIVHELSHWLMAKLLRMRTGKLSIWPSGKGDKVRMGSLKVARADPIRESLVGLAPLIGGSLVILVIGDLALGLGEAKDALFGGTWSGLQEGLSAYIRVPDFWLWLYLIFSVSNAMFPSEADRRPWGVVLLFLSLIALSLWITGLIRQIPDAVAERLLTATGYLAYIFCLAVAVDAIFLAIIVALEALVHALTGRGHGPRI